MIRLIIVRRLMEIKDNLEALLPQLDPNSKVYKDAKASLARINRILAKVDMSKLPKDVRVNTSHLKMRNGKLYGKVLMSDNRRVYFITLENNKIKDMKIYEGGLRKMEVLESTLFKN